MTSEVPKLVKLNIPCPSADTATLVYEVLNVDKEPRRSGVSKDLKTEGDTLIASFEGNDLIKLRVSINGFLKNVRLIVKTLDQFSEF